MSGVGYRAKGSGSAAVLMYVFTPLAYSALHRADPDYQRPFVLQGGPVLAPLSFIAANLLVYWSGWGTVWRLLAVLVLGFVLMAISVATSRADRRPTLHWQSTVWMWPYLIGMAVISYLGQYGGGIALIPFWVDIIVVIVFSIAIFYWAVASVRPTAEVRESVERDRSVEVTEVLVAQD